MVTKGTEIGRVTCYVEKCLPVSDKGISAVFGYSRVSNVTVGEKVLPKTGFTIGEDCRLIGFFIDFGKWVSIVPEKNRPSVMERIYEKYSYI